MCWPYAGIIMIACALAAADSLLLPLGTPPVHLSTCGAQTLVDVPNVIGVTASLNRL